MAKRKAPTKSKAVLKDVKPTRASTPRQNKVGSNGDISIPEHPFIDLTHAERNRLDLQDYGFKKIRMPAVVPLSKIPRQKLPSSDTFVEPIMRLMQNKIFFLREYFLPEVKNLIWYGIDKETRSKSEHAMLAEAANPKAMLTVSYCAQDCLRMILYYAALFELEDKRADMNGEVREMDGYRKAERETNLINRGAIWEILRLEIAEQLPGDKRIRGQRAEVVLQGALRLVEKENGGDISGDVGHNGVENSGIIDVSVDMVDHEPHFGGVTSSSSSDYESSD